MPNADWRALQDREFEKRGTERTRKEDGCSRKVGGREKTKTGEETERCSPDDVAVWAFADPS